MNDSTTVRLGPQDADVGQRLKIARRLSTVDDTHADATYVVYELRGVVDVDIQTPYDIGGSSPESQIGVTFPSGRTEYIMGVIEDFDTGSGPLREVDHETPETVKEVVEQLEQAADDTSEYPGAVKEGVLDWAADELGYSQDKALIVLDDLISDGEVYEPQDGYLRTT